MHANDTIAAISTAIGDAAIAIIRLSGPDAFSVSSRIFAGGKPGAFQKMASHTVMHGYVADPAEGRRIDEVLLLKMASPRTYTREDVVEIHCHGGTVVAGEILRVVFACGVRPAEPGEFTRRAFLNGRIDLVKAEAVMDLIRSHTAQGARAAMEQLDGRLSEQIARMRESLLMLIGQMEVNLDYPEHDTEEVTLTMAGTVLTEVLTDMRALLESFGQGRILREGLNLVLAGRPNAGKSSLMNRLAGHERSIVTEVPGTTRDVVESFVNLRGLPVRLLDTAGLRETFDRVESLGVARTLDAMERAELIVAVFDGSDRPGHEDEQLVKRLKESGSRVLYVMNKTDAMLPEAEAALRELLPDAPVAVSALTGTGMEELTLRIAEVASGNRMGSDNALLLTNARHRQLLETAKARLSEASEACSTGVTHDVLAFLLREAWETLGGIIGEGATEDLLNSIFSRFCLGK